MLLKGVSDDTYNFDFISPPPFLFSDFIIIFLCKYFFDLISKSTIDQVYETARLEEVIGEFINLKKYKFIILIRYFFDLIKSKKIVLKKYLTLP